MLDFRGLSCATFTPMHDDGTINPSLIPAYANYLADNNIKGIFVNGTTGEGNHSLTVGERMELAEAWIRHKDKIPHVVVQVGGTNFTEAKMLAAHAEKIGASGIGILPNCFERPRSVDDLVDWVSRIAAAAPSTPCLYYHLPKYTHVDFPMDELLKQGAKKIPTLAGMKYSTSDLNDAGKCLQLERPSDGKKFLLMFGSDDTFLGHYGLGLDAAIGSSYNFAPKLFQDLMGAFDSGDYARAKELQRKVVQMFQAIFKQGSGTGPQKYAMRLLTGLEVGPPRFPLKTLAAESVAEMESDLRNLAVDFVFKTAAA